MAMTTDPSEDEILDVLRSALGQLPEVAEPAAAPAHVLDGAMWIHEWLTMDAELAELTFDSSQNLDLAGVRSAAGALREVTFVSNDLTIEMEIDHGLVTASVMGRVEPPSPGTLHLLIGGETHRSSISPDGTFRIEGLTPGTVLAFLELSGVQIRLGTFEI